MIKFEAVKIADQILTGVVHEMPGIRAVSISANKGVVTGGHIDIPILDARHPERRVVAARVLGVREVGDITAGKIHDFTKAAGDLGVKAGMTGADALKLMF